MNGPLSHGGFLSESLLLILLASQVHHKLAKSGILAELSSQSAELSAIYKIQQVKK